jgi:hypothetical protein
MGVVQGVNKVLGCCRGSVGRRGFWERHRGGKPDQRVGDAFIVGLDDPDFVASVVLRGGSGVKT